MPGMRHSVPCSSSLSDYAVLPVVPQGLRRLEAYFKALDLQISEMGMAFWACRSPQRVSNQFKNREGRGTYSGDWRSQRRRVEDGRDGEKA